MIQLQNSMAMFGASNGMRSAYIEIPFNNEHYISVDGYYITITEIYAQDMSQSCIHI